MINLNHTDLYLSNYASGTHQNIEVRLGRKLYLIDIRKDCLSCLVEIYRKLSTDRRSFSKYGGAGLKCVVVKKNAILTREFFENIDKITEAQRVIAKFKNILN